MNDTSSTDKDGDTEMIDSKQASKSYLKSLSKRSKIVDIAELKAKYEDQLEDKNQRILKLERKNQEYLDIIAMKTDESEQSQMAID